MPADDALVMGTVVHETKESARAVADRLEQAAAARGLVTVEAGPDGFDREVSVVVGIGGDGTLLQAAGFAFGGDIPVIGINLGRVGYLTDVAPDAVELLLDRLVAGSLSVNRRMTVAATAPDGRSFVGINEVALEKVMTQRVVEIGVEINDRYFTTYRSDGLIVATPLGSTAYSLSAGGPVVDPELDALIMTPVAPHSLLSRSIMLSPEAVVKVTVAGERPVRVNLDGREAFQMAEGEVTTIERGARAVRFLSLGNHPFPQAVRHQFGLDHA
ncbi:MAG: NAD(+)/NADH kinase [Acidimicrobiia bacterium]|jgi:NAD+ kinase